MPRVRYNNITFDSELEVEYYKHLIILQEKGDLEKFFYHFKKPIAINHRNNYTPDFICFYADRIEIVETKGYSQYSFMKDNLIHNVMLEKTTDDLLEYLLDNGVSKEETIGKDIVYKKIKYLKAFGWVDFDFKNPNTLANRRRDKIIELESEIKELKQYKKNCERYFSYIKKEQQGFKLTKTQKEWKDKMEVELLNAD